MKNVFYLLCYFLISTSLIAQSSTIQQVCPPHWWAGMKNENLQLLVYGENIGKSEVKTDYEGIQVSTQTVENPNYLFLDLVIGQTTNPGKIPFQFDGPNGKFTYEYELKERKPKWRKTSSLSTPFKKINERQKLQRTINPSDFIYLIMPDRFSNGNEVNDKVEGMNEQSLNRKEMYDRHGGDLRGIINNLDYLEELGITAIWLNPILVNDQPEYSYHGYAATDHYNIDPRFGTMEDYLELIEKCHERGMKMIKDVIHNHIGNEHWIFEDLPSKDWVHQWDKFTRTCYRATALFDPYGSEHDQELMLNGWFDHHMPDLDQTNQFLANYIIQNNIWWIEHAQIDGFRMDTYTYSDPEFLKTWEDAIFAEYPKFGMFGEAWVHGAPTQAYFHGNTIIDKPFKNDMPSLADFQLYYAINKALNEPFGWTEGVSRLYYTLAKDYLYKDPYQNVVFLDNHDASRYYSVVGEDIDKHKMGLAFLLTTRGIPCMYYGTEILMKNFSDPDGKVREDFPGGWQNDAVNKFKKEGRNEQENDVFDYVKTLANYRKNNRVLQSGKLMQFVPNDGVYTYFRYNQNKTVMIVMNSNEKEIELDCAPFAERMDGFTNAKNIITDETVSDLKILKIPAETTLVLELQK